MAALSDHKTRRRLEDARRLSDVSSATLRGTVARLRENGRAFGPMAEACRRELARRGEKA